MSSSARRKCAKWPKVSLWLVAGVALGVGCTASMVCAKTTTIKILTWFSDGRGTEKVIAGYCEAYQKLHPDIKVKLSMSTYADHIIVQKILAEAIAGIGSDIVIANNATFPKYEKLLTDLTPFMKGSGLNLSKLVPACRDAFVVGGKVKMIPFSAGAEVIYTNPSLIAARGLPPPQPGWTIDDYKEACAKLTSRDSNNRIKTVGAGFWGILNEGIWWLWSYGGDLLNAAGDKLIIKSPQAKQALEDMRGLVAKGYVRMAGADSYNSGTAGFHFGGPWMLGQFKTKFPMQVAPIPTGPNGKKTTDVWSSGWGISSGSKNKAAAWRFIEFMISKENQLLQAPSEPPVLITAVRDKRMLDLHQNVDYGVFLDALDYGRNFPVTRASNLILKLIEPELEGNVLILGKRSFDDAVARVEKPIEALLKSVK